MTVFPDELYPAPRSWAEKAYPKLIHFNEVDEGGHFAAWEQPQTPLRGDPGDVQVAALAVERPPAAGLPTAGGLPGPDGATRVRTGVDTGARPPTRRHARGRVTR